MFENYPFPTNMLFSGFILGTLPFIRGRFRSSLSGGKTTWKHIAVGIIFMMIVMLPVFIPDAEAGAAQTESGSMLMFFIIGIIIAATLVIPGLSGTMILTAAGFYKPLLDTASSFVTSLAAFDFAEAAALLNGIIPLGIGILIGGIIIAKLLSLLFRIIPSYIYAAVLGLICATPVVMLAEIRFTELNILSILTGAAALALGLFTGRKLGEKEN